MRLLECKGDGNVTLTEWHQAKAPRYAILSHTWGDPNQEVTFQDILNGTARNKAEYRKIEFCRKQAVADGLQYFWLDTCCIDKSNHSELSKAINSMFRWYRDATRCYVYLTDVSTDSIDSLGPWETQLPRSRWFTRGWTLQELLAPASVRFFSVEGNLLGDKMELLDEIHDITNIKISALQGTPLTRFSIHERMGWSRQRQTTEEEDIAYCLLGIFDVFIPLIYGEGEANAISRLQEAIDKRKGASNTLLPQKANPEAHILIPFGQNDEFVGREAVLANLVAKVLPDARKNDCQRTILEGLGGVGKTQIALEVAYRVHELDSDCSVFWVPAVNTVFFENAYRGIGEALGTPGMDDEKADVRALVKTSLERTTIKWLLIIDNVDDIGLLAQGGLQKYLPFNRRGSILFTTRNHEVAVRLDVSRRDTFMVGEMSEEESLELIRNGLEDRQCRDIQAAKSIVRHLVYLPLAIKQASAYIARTRMTTTRYLDLCLMSNKTQLGLLNTDFEERRRYSSDTNPITTTWLISFHHLAKSYPLAINYLKFICFLAEKDIPISLLPPEDNKQAKEEAVGVLEGYAFISVREQGDSFDIHRLVRLATRNWIKSEWKVCHTKAIQQLAKAYPFPKHENRHLWMRYMPHTKMALQMHEQCTDKVAVTNLLHNVASSYDELGKYGVAEQMHRQTLEMRKSILGLNHVSTLATMNNLAEVLRYRGKYMEAEQMLRETLELKESVLHPNHPSTLDSMDNLASVLFDRGKYKEAEAMHRQAFELYKLVLGPNHPSTLDCMNNLALALPELGKYEEAEKMHREELELCKTIQGIEHPSTLASMNNLALILRQRGKYAEAEQMNRETLELKKSVLYPDHPSTLDSMDNLAIVLYYRGKYNEAEAMHRQAIELYTSVLGPDHPATLYSMNNLAIALPKLGKYEEAEQIHRKTMELKKSVLGMDHPSTIQSEKNLRDLLDSLKETHESSSEASSEDSESECGVSL